MKQLSKIMLAAVASVALAAPAFAWDFSASGTATASFNQTSVQLAVPRQPNLVQLVLVYPVLGQV